MCIVWICVLHCLHSCSVRLSLFNRNVLAVPGCILISVDFRFFWCDALHVCAQLCLCSICLPPCTWLSCFACPPACDRFNAVPCDSAIYSWYISCTAPSMCYFVIVNGSLYVLRMILFMYKRFVICNIRSFGIVSCRNVSTYFVLWYTPVQSWPKVAVTYILCFAKFAD